MVAPFITLSVVSHRQGRLIAGLLSSLRDHGSVQHLRYEIILTLNVREEEAFLEEFRDLPMTVIRNSAPKGFGANHNAAFTSAFGNIFVVVNPDIILRAFAFEPMLRWLAIPSVGAWGPLVLSSDGEIANSARKFPTVMRLLNRVFGRGRTRDYPVDAGPVDVDWIAGMFMCMSRTTFARIGGFDERYFMYYEDADICRRLRREGSRVVFDPTVSVIHDAQWSSHVSLRYLSWHVRSAIRFLTGI